MRQTIFTIILIFAFCLMAFSQASESSCPKIKIKIPEQVRPEDTFKVFASFEKENQPSASKFNWTIIKGNEASKYYKAGIIEIDPKDLKIGDVITVLAESKDENCRNPAMAKTVVIPLSGGVPTPIEEYSTVSWIEEKARLDHVAFQMQNNKDNELLAFLSFDKKSSPVERKNYLLKILRYLSETRKLDKRRITFLISESSEKRIYFRSVPQDVIDVYYCDDCLVIKAEDFDKLENLFRPR